MDRSAAAPILHLGVPPAAAPGRIEHLQKCCDAMDWADPDFARILATALRRPPAYQRKQWEWVMIYRALEARRMLRPDARGIVFGAGREPLIFALAGKVGHLLVTDLYDAASPWATARTADPKGFLLKAAHVPVDPARIDVARMDMTAIDYDGPLVDFAYSACSFEHIGRTEEDFVSHLAQVKRILKPGGVYVLTTEMAWGPTVPQPHCFFFGLDDLLGIAQRSGLAAEEVFDARLRQVPLNAPMMDVTDLGLNAPALGRSFVTPWRGGHVYTSAMLVLTNEEQERPTRVLGHRDSLRWVQASRRETEGALWREWQSLRLRAPVATPAEGHEDFAAPSAAPPRTLQTAWVSLPPGAVSLRARPPAGSDASAPTQLLLRERALEAPFAVTTLRAKATAGEEVRMLFKAELGKAYSVLVRGPLAEAAPWSLLLRRGHDVPAQPARD